MNSSILRNSIFVSLILVGLSAIPIAIWGMDIDYKRAEVIGYLSMFFSLSLMYFGIKRYRDQDLGGGITFVQAFKAGLLITLVAAIAFGIYSWLLVGYWHPEFTEDYFTYMIENAQSSMTEAEFAVHLEKMEAQKAMFENPVIQGAVMAATILLIGLIVSIVMSLILKRNPAQSGVAPTT